jgi:hypothetical protein
MPICEVAAEYEPPPPPICLGGALGSCLGACDYGGFDFCWPLRSKFSRSAAISLTGQLESQLPVIGLLQQAQELATRRLAPAVNRNPAKQQRSRQGL